MGALNAAAAPTPARLAAAPEPAMVRTYPLGETERMRLLLRSAKMRLPNASTAPRCTMPIRLTLSGPSAKPHEFATAVSVALPATVVTAVRFGFTLRMWQPYSDPVGNSAKKTDPSGAISAELGYAALATLMGPSSHPKDVTRPA